MDSEEINREHRPDFVYLTCGYNIFLDRINALWAMSMKKESAESRKLRVKTDSNRTVFSL